MQSKAALFKNHISLLALGENNFPKVMLIYHVITSRSGVLIYAFSRRLKSELGSQFKYLSELLALFHCLEP